MTCGEPVPLAAVEQQDLLVAEVFEQAGDDPGAVTIARAVDDDLSIWIGKHEGGSVGDLVGRKVVSAGKVGVGEEGRTQRLDEVRGTCRCQSAGEFGDRDECGQWGLRMRRELLGPLQCTAIGCPGDVVLGWFATGR